MHDPRFIAPSDERLPEAVRQVAPACRGLWFAGDAGCVGRGVRIGIVGSRHPRADSVAHARRIAGDCARLGLTVVSGLAIGIDSVAHRAALDAGGETVAVLAGGLGNVYPARNRELAAEIAGRRSGDGVVAGPCEGARGAVLTEYGTGTEPAHRHRFRERNRIIAALSDYLVVVQATPASGSMLTVRAALDLGVPVGVVPSAPDDPWYAGSIDLISDGADCVVDGPSVVHRLELHGIAKIAPTAARPAVQLPAPLGGILAVARTLEEIGELTGASTGELRRMLHEFEEVGAVAHTDDGCWIATSAPAPLV